MSTTTNTNSRRLHQLQSIERKAKKKQPLNSSVAAIILGGGQGTRLFPLTQSCCKPALLFGGRYRLIDVPISNSLNSGIYKIFIVSQFLARPLHRHIFQSYHHPLQFAELEEELYL